jgi:hypothetical protein
MNHDDSALTSRRRLLIAALMGGAATACAPRGEQSADSDLWQGFDERITERTLAEAGKLFGIQFS